MEEELLYLESNFSFVNDKRVVTIRIKTITDEITKELKCITNYSLVEDVFKIIVESKDQLKNSPTLLNFSIQLAKDGIQLSDLILFERKMLLVSVFLQFESFYMNMILLGAFYYPDAFKVLSSTFFKGKNLERLEASIKNKDSRAFFYMVIKYLKKHSDIHAVEKMMKGLFGENFNLDHETKQHLSDFKAVRNIVVHQNSKPIKKDFDTIKIKGVVVRNSIHDIFRKISGKETSLPNIITFRLDLKNPDFWRKILAAMIKFIQTTQDVVKHILDEADDKPERKWGQAGKNPGW